MITPRQFEEKMKEIAEEYAEKPEVRKDLILSLMADTLDTQGYQAGTKIFRETKTGNP